MLKTKNIKIGDYEVIITQFTAIELLEVRKELAGAIKLQLDMVETSNSASIIKAIAGLIYEIPVPMLFKLFSKCAAVGEGGLNNESNFNKVFTTNVDGTLELAMEVLDFNGFFTLNTISIICKKIPMFAPMEKAMLEALKGLKDKKA